MGQGDRAACRPTFRGARRQSDGAYGARSAPAIYDQLTMMIYQLFTRDFAGHSRLDAAVGLAAWIGLVGLATAMTVVSVEVSTLSLPAWLGTRASASPNTGIRSPAGFENILQRPLFSRSRQGAAVAVSTPPPPPPVMLDQNIALKGVFMNGTLAKAFLTSAQDPVGVWVQANDEIAGWRVVAVKPDQVLLEGRNEKLVIPLNVNGAVK